MSFVNNTYPIRRVRSKKRSCSMRIVGKWVEEDDSLFKSVNAQRIMTTDCFVAVDCGLCRENQTRNQEEKGKKRG